MPKTTTVSDRFWNKVKKIDDLFSCWEWTGYRSKSGYGSFQIDKYPRRAHRVSFLLTYGPFDSQLYVLHRCDNPSCVRPDHLFLGTPKDNSRDMASKGRTVIGTAKLNKEKASEIRRLRKEGISLDDLAIQFSVCTRNVRYILEGKYWR